MKLNLRFETINFFYTSPISVGKNYLTENRALIIHISAPDMKASEVQLSSLPEFHKYNIQEWKFFLENFFLNENLNFESLNFDLPFFNTSSSKTLNDGELLFVVESVLFSFIEANFPKVLTIPHPTEIKINQLYSKELDAKSHSPCIKIKIKPPPHELKETMDLLEHLSNQNPSIRFRLDGNRRFDFDQLSSWIIELEKNHLSSAIEYIEEPFKNFSDTYLFKKISNVPLSLDESLIYFLDDLDRFPDFYFILKPSLLGISRCVELSKKYSPRVIISSSYEHHSAIKSLYYLAGLNPNQYHGLDTLKFIPN